MSSNMFLNRTILLLIISSCLFQICTAVICYSCQSTHDQDCADPIKKDRAAVANCTEIPIPRGMYGAKKTEKCSKIEKQDKVKGTIIIRSCFYASDNLDKCMQKPGPRSEYKICDVCDGELCNKSTMTVPSSITMFSLMLFVPVIGRIFNSIG